MTLDLGSMTIQVTVDDSGNIRLFCYDEIMNSKEQLYNFLNAHEIAVISTIHINGTPESAVIGFGQTPELEIIFGTDNSSRKYKNLKANAHVAIVIGWDNRETVQYEGVARELTDKELPIIEDNYWHKTPQAKKHHQNPNERYFLVSPQWLQYTNLNVYPWDTVEMRF